MSSLSDTLPRREQVYYKDFVACVALSPERARQEVGWLDPEKIYDPAIRAFWKAILAGENLVEAARAVDPDFYTSLTDWIYKLPDFANLTEYAQKIEKLAYHREVYGHLTSLASALGQEDESLLREHLQSLQQVRQGGQTLSLPASESLEGFINVLDNLEGRSIPTYLPPLDAATGGLERQTLSIFAARPGMGKTALAWQLAQNIAHAGMKALFVTLEMSANNLWARAACGRAGVRWRDLRSGKATPADKSAVYNYAMQLMGEYDHNLWVNDKPNTVSSLWREMALLEPDIVIIDHLRWLRDGGENEITRLGSMSARLKEASKQFNCHVFLLHQLSRGLESRDDKRPRLSDLRESGHLEENADNVFFLYRPDYYNPTTDALKQTEFIIGKFRDDVMNQAVMLDFDPGRQWFEERSQKWKTVNMNGSNGHHKQERELLEFAP